MNPGGSSAPTILVVDDEPHVLKLMEAMLTHNGYRVLSARDGASAVRTFERHQGVVDLLLTDVIMEGMSGPMLADRLSALRPDLRVLFVSGYHDKQVVQKYVLEKGFAFLPKPFTLESLTGKVREILK